MRNRRRIGRSAGTTLALVTLTIATLALTGGSSAAEPPGKPTSAPPARPYAGPYEQGRAAPAPAKGQPSAAPAPQEQACKLRRSPDLTSGDEFLTCIRVVAELSQPPAVGETAGLTFEVLADFARANAKIEIELPSNLEFVKLPAAMSAATGRSADDGSGVPVAAEIRDLAADQPERLQATVRAVAPGTGTIRVRASAPAGGRNIDAGDDAVFLTVGETSATSKFGIDVPETGGTAPIASGVVPKRANPRGTPMAAQPDSTQPAGQDEGERADAVNALACAVGGWFFVDNNGNTRPAINWTVEAWDDDTASADDIFASGVTGLDGSYSLCSDNADGEGGTVDLYVRFISTNALWRVRDTAADNNYAYNTGTVNDIPAGNTNFGNLQPGDTTLHRGSHAFDAVNSAFFFGGSVCWDAGENPCRQHVIRWSPSSTQGTYYCTVVNAAQGCPTADQVYLLPDDPNSRILVGHELGHSVMDDVYNDAFPPSPNCSPHSIFGAGSTGCAWTEGWAEWYPAMIENEKLFRFPNQTTTDLENQGWADGLTQGDTVEGRVAGALIDISDPENEIYWDAWSEGDPGPIWTTFQAHVSNNMVDFMNHRAIDGFNTADSGARSSVFQNTIDYQFRNPLNPYAELTRPTPTPPHNYRHDTIANYWSVVAIRPTSGDHDLQLYDDRGVQTPINLLDSSAFGSTTIDFVAVDSNLRPAGDYYARVFPFNTGVGQYQIELARGADVAGPGTHALSMNAGDVAIVRDTNLSAGIPRAFRVVPTNGGQDPELFLMGPNAGDPVQGRAAAVANSSANVAGVAEQFLYNPPATGWAGIVLTNKSGAGGYTLYVDDSGPSGSVTINSGSPATNNPNVTLTLSASDAQTGVEAMQISVDGVADTEPFVPFATSTNVTLPGADGSKAVAVKYRNNAGMVSPQTSDTIFLDRVPPVTTASLSGTPTGCTDQFFGNVTVTLSASDTVGINNTQYRVDGGAFQNYTGPFAVSGKQAHTIAFRSTDAVGNQEALKSRTFTIGPLANAPAQSSPTKKPNVTGTAFKSSEVVSIRWDGVQIDTATASASCNFTKQVTVPETTFGNHTLSLVGQTSGQTATDTVKIKPLIVLANKKGAGGSANSVTGYGYQAGETVEYRWNSATGPLLGTRVVGANGTAPARSFNVPNNAPGVYNVFGKGLTSGATAKAKFTIT